MHSHDFDSDPDTELFEVIRGYTPSEEAALAIKFRRWAGQLERRRRLSARFASRPVLRFALPPLIALCRICDRWENLWN